MARWVSWAAMLASLAVLTGCTATVTGTATAPTGANASVVRTDDGAGVQLGYPFAPVAIEIYIEPLCPACARFEASYGDELAAAIDRDELSVTYRPLIFIDEEHGFSQTVSNALFAATDPGAGADAADVQEFLQAVFAQLRPFRAAPDAADIAETAEQSGLPTSVVDRIAADEAVVDTDQMNLTNVARFRDLLDESPYTPMVYNLTAQTEVQINRGWLARVLDGA